MLTFPIIKSISIPQIIGVKVYKIGNISYILPINTMGESEAHGGIQRINAIVCINYSSWQTSCQPPILIFLFLNGIERQFIWDGKGNTERLEHPSGIVESQYNKGYPYAYFCLVRYGGSLLTSCRWISTASRLPEPVYPGETQTHLWYMLT